MKTRHTYTTRIAISIAKRRASQPAFKMNRIAENGILTCQWIEGEPTADDSCKCGVATESGKSYCSEHYARAYLPRTKDADPK